jgi:ATP-dependent DNA helicase RecG
MKESNVLEFKENMTNTFLKTVSAYANYRTGKIQFGITDEGVVAGVSNPSDMCLDIENKINDSIVPQPNFSMSINRLNHVITLMVEEGANKPYLYKGKAYKRNDTATVEVDNFELKRLVLAGINMNFEDLKAGLQQLNFKKLGECLADKLGVHAVTDDVLRTLGLITKKKEYNNAAELLADTNSFTGIDIVKFGRDINEIDDRATFTNISILSQYEETVNLYKKYYQKEVINGISRKNVEILPEVAFREAVANALVHREWDIKAHIKISMYQDRIEIASQGGLPYGLSREEYLRGNISSLRNPIIGNVFYRLNYIEMFGTGIRRINEAYKKNDIHPNFETFNNSIVITLPVISSITKLSTNEDSIYKIFSSGKQLASSEIAEITGYSKNKVLRLLRRLVDKKYVQVIGTGRGTKYGI